MSKSVGDVRSWLELQSAKLRIPDINMLIDMYLTIPDDDEIASLTTGLLGDTPTIRTFLHELINLRLMSGISSKAAARESSFPSITSSSSSSSSSSSTSTAMKPKPKQQSSLKSPSAAFSPTPAASAKGAIKGISALTVPTYQYGEEEATKPVETPEEEEARKKREEFPDLPSATATPVPEDVASSNLPTPSVDEQLHQAVLGRIKVKKTKPRKVNLPGTGPSALLSPETRQFCGCQCREHSLIGNCTTCGRIVCEQEGEGPCYFCGSYVATMGKGDNAPNPDFTHTMQEATVYAGGFFLNKKAVHERVMAEEDAYTPDLIVADAKWDGKRAPVGRTAARNKRNQSSSNSVISAEEKAGAAVTLRPNALSTAIVSNSVYAVKDASLNPEDSSRKANDKTATRQSMGLLAATTFRDNLLRRAKEQGNKPKIYDEQNDYYDFEGNAWLNAHEREERQRMVALAEEAVEDMRKTYTLDIDVSTGRVGLSSGLREGELSGIGAIGGAVSEVNERVLGQINREKEEEREKLEREKFRGATVTADTSKVYSVYERGGYAKAGIPSAGKGPGKNANTADSGATTGPGVSHVFRNDTLSGRAKQVYDSMRKLIKENVQSEKPSGKFQNSRNPNFPSRIQREDMVGESVGVDAFDTVIDHEADASFLPGSRICDPWGNSGLSKNSRTVEVSGNMAFSGSGVWGNTGTGSTYLDLSTWEGPDMEADLLFHTSGGADAWGSNTLSSSSSSSLSPSAAVAPSSFAEALGMGLPTTSTGVSTGTSNAVPVSRWAGGTAHLGYQSPSDLALSKADEVDEGSPMSDGAKTLTSALLGGYISANYIQKGFGDRGDVGMCLSMHQPWASLLLHGLKRFEGRGWASSYRGRLWIAATARKPDVDEVMVVEDECRRVYGSKNKLKWPKSYPHGVLLGCVDMVGCWTHDEFLKYREDKMGQGYLVEENESQHVFVCTNPRMLTTPLTITGQHKMWTLPANLHRGLTEQLTPVNDDLALFVKQEEKEKEKKEEKRRFAEGLENVGKEQVILPKKKK